MLRAHSRSLPLSQWGDCLELHFPEDTRARCSNCSEAVVLTTFPGRNCGLAYEGGGALYLLHFPAYLRNCSIHLGLRESHGTPFPGVLWESLYTCNAVRAWRRLHFPACLTVRDLLVRDLRVLLRRLNFPKYTWCWWTYTANRLSDRLDSVSRRA